MGGTFFVVEERANPSTDFFVLPFLREQGVTPVRCSFSQLPPVDQVENVSVLFVRYVPAAWKQWIQQNRTRLNSVLLFMDDDLFDWRVFCRLPLRSQWKLLRYSWSRQRWLKSVGAQLLVSTPYLQQKYSNWHAQVLAAQPIPRPSAHSRQTIFYHGSASHLDDLRWLYPVIEEVLTRNQYITFEVIGDVEVNRLFKYLPRVHVLHPMKWPAYQALIERPGRTIGLAPLLDPGFNRARSHTKFYDITQAGAVGIYAAGPVYGDVIKHGENGLLLPMDSAVWVESILQLTNDDDLRKHLLDGARACL